MSVSAGSGSPAKCTVSVPSQVDMAVVEVALGQTDHDLVDGLVGNRAARRSRDSS